MEEKRKEDGKKNLNLKFEILCSAVDEQQAQNICAIGCAATLLIGMGQFFLNFYPTYGTERSTLFLRLVESIMADIKKKLFHGRKLWLSMQFWLIDRFREIILTVWNDCYKQ